MASGNIFDFKMGGLRSESLTAFFNPPPKSLDEEYRYYLCIMDDHLRPIHHCKQDTYDQVLIKRAAIFPTDRTKIVAISRTLPAALDHTRLTLRLDSTVRIIRDSK